MKSRSHRVSALAIICLLIFLVGQKSGVSGRGRAMHSPANSQPHSANARLRSETNRLDSGKQAQIRAAYGRLPLRFEANRGQFNSQVQFISRNSGHTLFLTANQAVLSLRQSETGSDSTGRSKSHSATVKLTLAGANAQPRATGLEELPGKSNYFLGADPRRWRTNVANYAQVKYEGVYPGIDLLWHGNQRQLEHDFLVAPGADPRRIRLAFNGVETMRIDGRGALVLQTGAGDLRLLRPRAWQEINGQKRPVACAYAINGQQQIQFRLGAYDRSRKLIIDPVLLYSSYIGGNGYDQTWGVAVDKDGSAYIVGLAGSTDFPGSSPIQPAISSDGVDAFVLKLNPSGTAAVYGTWLGGGRDDIALGVRVDQDGNAYVAGYTFSTDFPVTAGALQPASGGFSDGFIVKLNPAGSALAYSSYVGGDGDDSLQSLAIDAAGNAYLTGSTQSSNLPATGIQSNRSSQPLFNSTDRAGNWTQIGSTLNTTQAYTLTIDPTNPNILYAGTFLGVYKSTDGGQHWQITGQNNPATAPFFVGSVAIDPANPSRIYAASRTGGIYRSTDGGQSYQANVGINFNGSPSGFDVVVDPVTPTTLYLATSRGVYKTTNGGDTWATANVGLAPLPLPQLPRVNRLVFDPTNHLTLYAATTRNVFKSVDGAATWTQVRNGLGQNDFTEILSLAIDPETPATLYAGTNSSFGGLYKTTDGGATWRASATGLTIPNSSSAQTVQSLAIDPSATTTVYAGVAFGGVYKSTDGGATWNPSSMGLPNTVVNAVVVDRANPSNIYAAISAGNDAFAAKINPSGSALVWLTYLGGGDNEDGRGVAVDKDGNAYVTGATNSRDFPTTNAFQAANGGGSDAYVAKLNAAGSALIYSTYYGGSNTDAGRGIAVNDAGQAFITGTTNSGNLPTKNPLFPALGGGNDAFVAKFNAAGSALDYATWLGGTGNDNGVGIAVDGAGNVYVTGDTLSANFPLVEATQTQLKGTDAFVAKLNPAGSGLIYSTFLGGTSIENGTAIAVDSKGNAYVIGNTFSTDFPTIRPYKPSLRGDADGFLTKLGVETDLAIVKTASRNPVLVNNSFSYTLTATNNGPSPATGVVVTDQLPAGVNFVSALASQGSCANNAGTVTCAVGNLAVQGKATVTLIVTPTAAGLITNLASVSGDENDSNPANDQALLQITISNQPSIYGRVTLPDGTPLSSITINMTGAVAANQQTNAQGLYQFANLPPTGNYTLTPASSAYSFEPAVRDVNNLTMDQAADFIATPCTYAISPTNQSFEANGGGGAIVVTAPPRCPWMATASATWIKITSGLSGAGTGTVTFTVDPTATPRSGRITIAGQSFLIWQGVNVCNELKFRPRNYFGFGFPNGLFADDLNGDGLTDLVVSQETIEFDPTQQRFILPLVVHYGAADGQLTPSARIYVTTATRPRAVAAGDTNGDGRRDLIVGAFNDPNVQLLLSDGNGGFTSGTSVRISPLNTSDYPDGLRAADLNKDGKLDLIGTTSTKVLIALNTSTGNTVGFAPAYAISFEGQNFRGLADVNNDGVIDLVTVGGGFPGGPGLAVYPGDGLGSFRQPIASPLTDSLEKADFADFNADGNPDLAAAVLSSTPQGNRYKVALLYGDGAGHFGQLTPFDPLLIDPSGQEIRLFARDVNNDGRPDVLILGEQKVRAVLTDATGKPGSVVEIGSTENFNSSAFVVGNFDAGGRLDFATIDGSRSSVVIGWNRCGIGGLTISGRVLDRTTPAGFGGVTVNLSGALTATTTTDSGGNYEFTGLGTGDYTVMVERSALEFIPASQTVNNLTTDQVVNFSGIRKGTTVSAASFAGQSVAPDSIASIFGPGMSRFTEIAQQQPLPIRLANQYVYLKDSAGVERAAQLFFVSPDQINFLIPAETALGPASIHVFTPANANEPDTVGTLLVEKVAPGLFAANANGAGVAAAVVFRIKADGTQSYEAVSQFDGAKFVSVPIDLSSVTDQVFLLLFGTGIRNNTGLAGVSARIGGEAAEVSYAGAQGDFAGLDQVNVLLPRGLAGRGEVDVVLTVDGKQTNTVRVNIK